MRGRSNGFILTVEMGEELWICPGCGAELRVGVRGCPNCQPRRKRRKVKAVRENKPWAQDRAGDGLDLPGEDFDYDEFVNREFGRKPHRQIGIAWYWWLTALLLVILIAWRWV